MLKIRFQRVGRKNDPSYRVVVTDSKKGPKSGNNVEIVGSYSPKGGDVVLKEERVQYWISNGAQVSDTVHNLLVKKGIIKSKKKHVSRGKKNTRDVSAEGGDAESTTEAGEGSETTESDTQSDTGAPIEVPVEEKTEVSTPVEEKKEEAEVVNDTSKDKE